MWIDCWSDFLLFKPLGLVDIMELWRDDDAMGVPCGIARI
jgi:hypothetical protein